MSSNKRLYSRLSVNVDMLIYLHNGSEYHAKITDISEAGIAFLMLLRDFLESELTQNSQVKFLLVDNKNYYKPFIQAQCIIRHIETDGVYAHLGAYINDETYSKYVSVKKTIP